MTDLRKILLTVFILIAGFAAPFTAFSQETLPPDQGSAYLIQPEDILGIVVWPLDELSMEITVRPDGMISFPIALNKTADEIQNDPEFADLVLDPDFKTLAADPEFVNLLSRSEIRVGNMTVSRLGLILRLRLNPIATNPRVAVNVKNFRHMRAFVLGAVKTPGVYEIRTGDTVMDLITRAGGVTEEAKQSKIAIVRPPENYEPYVDAAFSTLDPEEKTGNDELPKNMITVNLAEVVGKGVFPEKSQYIITNGDIVFVPKGNKVDWKKIYGIVTSLYYAFSLDSLIK